MRAEFRRRSEEQEEHWRRAREKEEATRQEAVGKERRHAKVHAREECKHNIERKRQGCSSGSGSCALGNVAAVGDHFLNGTLVSVLSAEFP